MAITDYPVRPADVMRSLVFYPLFYCVSLMLISLNLLALPLPPGVLFALVRVWCGWHRWCCRHVLGIRVVVEGAVPDGAVLCAIRHESFFEAIDLPILLRNPVVFAKAELFAIPIWGLLARRYGLVMVDRQAGARALRGMIAAALVSASAGGLRRPIAIFPEGTRVPHDDAPALQAGFAGIYKMAGLPVVPIAVDSGPLYHRRWKRAGLIRYRVGAMLPPGLPRGEIEERVRVAINALH